MHLLKSSTIIVANVSEYSLMSFVGISLDCEVGVKVFDFFNYKGLCYFIETKIRLLYLIHTIFDGRNTRILGWYLYFSIIDVKEFISDVVTSLTLYASIPRFGTMLTKN